MGRLVSRCSSPQASLWWLNDIVSSNSFTTQIPYTMYKLVCNASLVHCDNGGDSDLKGKGVHMDKTPTKAFISPLLTF